MESDLQDQGVIRLLSKLKDIDNAYPESMLVLQRRNFLKRMTQIELGIPTSGGPKNTAGDARLPHSSPITQVLLETALITVIAAEVGMTAYLCRDDLKDFFQTLIKPGTEDATFPPVMPTSLEIQGVNASPAATSTLPSTTLAATAIEATATPISTSIPAAADIGSGTPTAPQLNATPAPEDNNGNHYGQTPKPERTKENSGSNDKPPKDDNDKPPKEKDDNPSEEDKPPKEK